MENRNMKNLLIYMKKYDIVKKYQITFDKYLDLEKLLLIDDKDVDRIICENECYSLIELYEIINGVKINNDIKEYISLLDDNEVIRYCLRLSISQDFNSEEEKKDYIKALSESNGESVRFAYGIAASKLYINSDDGIEYVKMISKCKSEVAIHLIDILHTKKYREDDELYEFINLVKDAKEGYIAEYMVDLFKNEDTNVERLPISSIAILMNSKGRRQAYYASSILTNPKLIESGISNKIASIIACCEYEEKAKKLYFSIISNKEINVDSTLLFSDNESEESINIIVLLKSRNIDEILKILSNIPDNEQIRVKMKIKL